MQITLHSAKDGPNALKLGFVQVEVRCTHVRLFDLNVDEKQLIFTLTIEIRERGFGLNNLPRAESLDIEVSRQKDVALDLSS